MNAKLSHMKGFNSSKANLPQNGGVTEPVSLSSSSPYFCSEKLEQNDYLEFSSYEKSPFEVINRIKDYIIRQDCPCLSVDISEFNMFDAAKICVLSSVCHLSKYPDGLIEWYIKDYETYRSIKMLRLNNIRLKIYKDDLLNQLYKVVS